MSIVTVPSFLTVTVPVPLDSEPALSAHELPYGSCQGQSEGDRGWDVVREKIIL